MGLSKKIRFEVFKRDSFTCQYCGKAAPDVVLHVDHIKPRSKGGSDDITNLVTSCRDCNLGKSNRELDDDAVMKQRKRQLDELQERREQLEMMLEWQRSLIDLEAITVAEVAAIWDDLVPGYHLNEGGLRNLRKWLKRFEPLEVIEAMRIAVGTYLEWEDVGQPTHQSVNHAYSKVPGIAYNRRRQDDKPYLADLYYIRGICRRRFTYYKKWQVTRLLEDAFEAGLDAEFLKRAACEVSCWSHFKDIVENSIAQEVRSG